MARRSGEEFMSVTLLETLQSGLASHQGGRLAEAERLYGSVLEHDPEAADAWHLLAHIRLAERDFARAQAFIARAIRLRPDLPAFHSTLGDILTAQGRGRDAVLCYGEAVRLDAAFVPAWVNLGNLLQAEGKLEDACIAYARALESDPDSTEALNNLGNSLRALGRGEEAAQCYHEAFRRHPERPEAPVNLAAASLRARRFDEAETWARRALELRPGLTEALSNLSVALLEQERYAEAESPARQAVAQAPEAAHLHSNLASVLLHQKRWEEAEQECRRALELRPGHPEATNNLGVILQSTERLEEAGAQFEKLLTHEPQNADAWTNLGAVRAAQARHGSALFCLEKALRLDPGHAKAHFCHALELLARGQLEEGFEEYEWRWKVSRPAHRPQARAWDGSRLDGRTVLLFAEQGLGDTIQFARYIPLVAERVGHVVVECQPSAVPIVRSIAGVADVVTPGATDCSEVAAAAPLLSLPRIFKTALSSVPGQGPYVSFDRNGADRMETALGPRCGLRVGLAWAGNPENGGDRGRSVTLETLAPLANMPGVEWISLHVGERARQEVQAAGGWLRAVLMENGGLMELAALMSRLDLVITVDTMAAHLAGALSRPVWTLLCAAADWRWLRTGESTPWYPSMRLFRQARPGDWGFVVDSVREALFGFRIQSLPREADR
jgi:tetratricopeptide (TPR) repeat protein